MTNGGLVPWHVRRRAPLLLVLLAVGAVVIVAVTNRDDRGNLIATETLDPTTSITAGDSDTTGAPATSVPVPPTTTTTVPRPTTSAPVVTTTSSPVTGPIPPPELELLVAGPDGIGIWSAGQITPVLTDRHVQRALPDGLGGVVFQDRRALDQWPDGPSEPIRRLPAGASEPEVLVEEPTSIMLLTTEISDAHRLVTYLVAVPDPAYCPDGGSGACAETTSYDLVLWDLDSGAVDRVETYSGWEYVAFRYDIGRDLAAIQYSDYDDNPFCLGVT